MTATMSISILVLLCSIATIHGFVVLPGRTLQYASTFPITTANLLPLPQRSSTSRLFGGGFGGGGDDKTKAKKEIKLKPKQQWDRYQSFKKEPKIRVAVRLQGDDEWLEVGRVKSQENQYTELAVARQRAIIAEVSY
jgi:hypothetical protein